MVEADRDRLQLIKEKEALLQELRLISQQQRSPEDIKRLEEEIRRLEDEIQEARATSSHGATERFAHLMDDFVIIHIIYIIYIYFCFVMANSGPCLTVGLAPADLNISRC